MFPVTSLYAGVLALLLLALSANVIVYRRRNRLSLGDEGDRNLLQRMRAQGNCAEYAPLAIVLLILCEAQGAPTLALHVLGLTILGGRLIHAYAFLQSPPAMTFRVMGMFLTITMIAVSAFGLILHGLF